MGGEPRRNSPNINHQKCIINQYMRVQTDSHSSDISVICHSTEPCHTPCGLPCQEVIKPSEGYVKRKFLCCNLAALVPRLCFTVWALLRRINDMEGTKRGGRVREERVLEIGSDNLLRRRNRERG